MELSRSSLRMYLWLRFMIYVSLHRSCAFNVDMCILRLDVHEEIIKVVLVSRLFK